MKRFEWDVIWESVPFLLQGALATLEISLAAIVLGTVVGLFFGLASVSGNRPLRLFTKAYVYFIRGTPPLVQVFLVYFALPVLGINLPPFWAGVVALSVNAGGFIAEIVRAGIESIDVGQAEAAFSIGMTRIQAVLRILFPQSIRRIVPPLTNEVITLIKGSSLLSVISVFELTRAGQVIIAAKFTPFEIYFALALMYLAIVAVMSQVSELVETRMLRRV